MAAVKESFVATGSSITITLASLANNGQRQSTVVDNSSNLDLDAMLSLKVKTGTISGTAYLNVYAFGTADGGTTYDDNAGASDAAITLTSPPNMKLIGVINAPASTTTYISALMSVAQAFGGILPYKWGIVVENKTGGALDATGGNFVVTFTRVQQTVL